MKVSSNMKTGWLKPPTHPCVADGGDMRMWRGISCASYQKWCIRFSIKKWKKEEEVFNGSHSLLVGNLAWNPVNLFIAQKCNGRQLHLLLVVRLQEVQTELQLLLDSWRTHEPAAVHLCMSIHDVLLLTASHCSYPTCSGDLERKLSCLTVLWMSSVPDF